MILTFDKSKIKSSLAPPVNTKKLNWKDKFKRELYGNSIKIINSMKSKKSQSLQEEDQKRVAAKALSILFQKGNVTIEDNQEEFPRHGYYSSYVPLMSQSKFDDQIYLTFPYIQYLAEKQRHDTKTNVYNEISTYLRSCKDKGQIQLGWRKCLEKYLCDIDSLLAVDIYVQFLKKGTQVLNICYQKYGGNCQKQVFFFRICQISKYFKDTLKVNKSVKTTLDVKQQISEVSLPKTMKQMFCSICLLYDCGQHQIDQKAVQNQYQYVCPQNVINQSEHISNIIKIIQFHQKLLLLNQKLQIQNDEMSEYCSRNCFKSLTHQSYLQQKKTRRPIQSLLHRSLIKLGKQLFSYDPCAISLLLPKDTKNPQSLIACKQIFFFFTQEFNIYKQIQKKTYATQYECLLNQKSRLQQKQDLVAIQKKEKKRTKKQNNFQKNYKISNCFHHFIGKQSFDLNCQNCCCHQRGFCLPQCLCSDSCLIKKKGCNCKAGKDQCRTKKCPCFNNKEQCLPGVCSSCFQSEGVNNKKNNCKNWKILRGDHKLIRIGISTINGAGLGAFAGQNIQKDDLVSVYTGQIIDGQIESLRVGLSYDLSFYNFSFEGSAIDARYMGNKSRFVNHGDSGQENLRSEVVFSQGRSRIVFYAQRNIKKGEQLFFDYDGAGELFKNFKDKYPFIRKKKK